MRRRGGANSLTPASAPPSSEGPLAVPGLESKLRPEPPEGVEPTCGGARGQNLSVPGPSGPNWNGPQRSLWDLKAKQKFREWNAGHWLEVCLPPPRPSLLFFDLGQGTGGGGGGDRLWGPGPAAATPASPSTPSSNKPQPLLVQSRPSQVGWSWAGQWARGPGWSAHPESTSCAQRGQVRRASALGQGRDGGQAGTSDVNRSGAASAPVPTGASWVLSSL